MSKAKLQANAKTVPLVVHVPAPFKKKIILAAKKLEVPVSRFVREALVLAVR